LRVMLYLLCIVYALVLLTLARPHTEDGLIHQVGKNCALVGFALVALQAVLAARFKWIERPFGMDMVIRFHKAAAILALVFLSLHPMLVAWGNHHGWLLYQLDIRWPVWLGRLALLALAVNIVTSLARRKLRIKFERWRALHNVLGIGIACFGFVHSYRIGGDLTSPTMRVFWAAGFASVATVYFFHKIVRPAWLRHNQYEVTGVLQEAPKVWTVRLRPMSGMGITPYAPGQFQFTTFHRNPDLPVEEHHWTISSTPTRPCDVAMTIKESGDFTSTIGATMVGDKAEVLGPYGRFSYLLYPDEKDLLFLCAGIGITPFLSMLRHMHDTKAAKNVLLLWGNRSEKDIVAREELVQIGLSGAPRLEVVYFLSKPSEGWKGECGHIDMNAVRRFLVPAELAVRGIYLCCPPDMLRQLLRELRASGMSGERIHYELFSL
jgi:predicted ferric reductase